VVLCVGCHFWWHQYISWSTNILPLCQACKMQSHLVSARTTEA
jgi:hypothetical protein